jgi:hypothetical protein
VRLATSRKPKPMQSSKLLMKQVASIVSTVLIVSTVSIASVALIA